MTDRIAGYRAGPGEDRVGPPADFEEVVARFDRPLADNGLGGVHRLLEHRDRHQNCYIDT